MRILLIILFFAACTKIDKPTELIISDKGLVPPNGFNSIARFTDDEIVALRKGNGANNRDTDKDGIVDNKDNCKFVFNPDQSDKDGDSVGDACDSFTDADGDGVEDGIDNCPIYNPLQLDCNRNGIGDDCDPTPCTTTEYEYLVWLDFDGHYETNSWWIPYGGAPFTVGTSGLSQLEINSILNQVQNDYSIFKITVTTDSTKFFSTPINKRQKVVITQNHEWYGLAGGVAYVNTYGRDITAYVFSKALSYFPFFISGATSHEIGHTLNLLHQIAIDPATCVVTSSYRNTFIMGNPYYNQTWYIWGVGECQQTGTGLCGYRIQDDIFELSKKLPLK